MRRMLALVSLVAFSSLGCALFWPAAEIVTYPMDKDGKFSEAQQSYTNNIRYGLFDEALTAVEPELQPRFREVTRKFEDVRFTGYRIESVDLDVLATKATVVVVYKGYFLNSPYEREMRLVQKWRRAVPTQNWYVTPELDKLLGADYALRAISRR